MDLDIDYLDRQRNAKRARWRMRLAALAMVACAIMLGDLVAQAHPVDEDGVPEINWPDGPDGPDGMSTPQHNLFTIAG